MLRGASSAIHRNSAAMSRAVCHRSSGSFARQRRISRSREAGARGCSDDKAGGSAATMAAINEARLSPVNGRRPQSISKRTTPNAKMSVRPSTARPSICSGAMYGTVPAIESISVSRSLRRRIDWDLFIPFFQPGEAEVEQLDAVARQHDIARLEIGVHHAVPMRVVERIGDLDRGAQRKVQRQRAVLESRRQSDAVHVLHDQEDRGAVFANVVQRTDMLMGNAGDGARFATKPFDPAAGRLQELAREQLDGDRPIEPRIACPIHFAHPAGTERRQDLERAKAGAGRESHRMGLTRGSIAISLLSAGVSLTSVGGFGSGKLSRRVASAPA